MLNTDDKKLGNYAQSQPRLLNWSPTSRTTSIVQLSLLFLTIGSSIWMANQVDLCHTNALKHWVSQTNSLALILCASIFLMLLCATTPFVPTEAVAVSNGIIFGPILGIVITWTSALLSAYIAYSLSGYLKNRFHQSTLNKNKKQQLHGYIEKWGALGFLIARLAPPIPFFALNISAPYLPLSLKTYFLVTSISSLIYAVIFCSIGWYTAT